MAAKAKQVAHNVLMKAQGFVDDCTKTQEMIMDGDKSFPMFEKKPTLKETEDTVG